MAKKIFSQNYYPCYQEKFNDALTVKDFEKAYSIMRKFPSTESKPEEEIKRVITLAEGYKALSEEILDSIRNSKIPEESTLEKISRSLADSNL